MTLDDYYKIQTIESGSDNEAALALIQSLLFGVSDREFTQQEDLMFEHLLQLVETFEDLHYPME